jgi:transcriptional regulator with XRE-family HTH domain
MAKKFGETIREMREAQKLGLRTAAEQLSISPAYLSRIERGRENPPRPELIRRIAALLGGDADVLFRLADSTDPELAEYVNSVPKLPEFLRTAMAAKLSSDDFQRLIDQIQHESSSSTSRKKGNTRQVRRA